MQCYIFQQQFALLKAAFDAVSAKWLLHTVQCIILTAANRFAFINALLQHINQFHPLSAEAQEALEPHMEQKVLAKSSFLIQDGKICRHLYFLESGALRGFYHLGGKEVTHWFSFGPDFVTSFHSFTTGQPAAENIQLIEGSVLWAISKNALTNLMNTHHEIERLVRIAYEKYYLRLEGRFVNAQAQSATERYQALLQQQPHVLERVPLGYVAAYLGISPETLSRIRSRL